MVVIKDFLVIIFYNKCHDILGYIIKFFPPLSLFGHPFILFLVHPSCFILWQPFFLRCQYFFSSWQVSFLNFRIIFTPRVTTFVLFFRSQSLFHPDPFSGCNCVVIEYCKRKLSLHAFCAVTLHTVWVELSIIL